MTHLSSKVGKLKKRNLIISSIVVIAILIVGYALIRSRAAGQFILIDPNGTTVSGNATLVSDANIAGGKALQFNAPVTTPPPTTPPTTPPPTTPPPSGTLLGWQVNANNIGLKAHGLSCDSLPKYTGAELVPAGTTISGKRVEGRLDVSKGNIIVEKSCIRPKSDYGPLIGAAYLDGANNRVADGPVTIRDSEITGELLNQYDAAHSDGIRGLATFQRNYVHHMGSGIAILLTGKTMSVTVENNFVEKLIAWGDGSADGTHKDGFTIRDFAGSGRSIIVRNNHIICDGGNESGAFFMQTWLGNIENVVAEGNLLMGGNYHMVLNAAFGNNYSNIKALNNRFGPSESGFQPASVQGGSGFAQWTDNYKYDASKPDAKGAVVNKP